jgi:hypothetical protein
LKFSVQLGFGGLLVGAGLGWFLVEFVEVSFTALAWLVVAAGAAIVVSALISMRMPHVPVGSLVGAFFIGLLLVLFVGSGYGFEGRYRAQEAKTFEGNVNANAVVLVVANRNGQIRVSTWNAPEYRIELTIKAKGYTDIEAQAVIDNLEIGVSEQRVQNAFKIVLNYNFSVLLWNKLAIEVTARLPASAQISLDLESSNGGIYLTDIKGSSINIHTSNGPLVLNTVYATTIQGSSSNGAVIGEIEAESTVLTTSNGGIELTIPCNASGNYDLSTSNGHVDLTISSSSNVAYDLDLSTSNGEVTIDLSGLEYTENERTSKIARTTGFEDQAIQIEIQVRTSNGYVTIGP